MYANSLSVPYRTYARLIDILHLLLLAPLSCVLLAFWYERIAQLLAEAEVRGPTMQPVYLARTASAFTKEGGTSAFLHESESTYGASGDKGETEIYHDTI